MFFSRVWIVLLLFPGLLSAQSAQKLSVVPDRFQWVRRIDVEGFVGKEDRTQQGVQNGRFRFRYLDPSVQAFVGLQTGLTHFNRALALEDPNNPRLGHLLFDLGANIGIIRGKHLWELDLMGVTAAGKLAAGVAIVGEHRLFASVYGYHRTQANFFTGDGMLDADQGLFWMVGKQVGFHAGYRILSTQHSNHNHAHIGLRLSFENPKIPYIFPSVG